MTPETIEKLKSYIQDHINEKITNKELAEKFAYCPQSLVIYFRKYEGISLRQYIIRTKMLKAKEYLKEGYYAAELPYMVGYNNADAFRKIYKKVIGESPKKTEMRLKFDEYSNSMRFLRA